jgi:hypothetical protein
MGVRVVTEATAIVLHIQRKTVSVFDGERHTTLASVSWRISVLISVADKLVGDYAQRRRLLWGILSCSYVRVNMRGAVSFEQVSPSCNKCCEIILIAAVSALSPLPTYWDAMKFGEGQAGTLRLTGISLISTSRGGDPKGGLGTRDTNVRSDCRSTGATRYLRQTGALCLTATAYHLKMRILALLTAFRSKHSLNGG